MGERPCPHGRGQMKSLSRVLRVPALSLLGYRRSRHEPPGPARPRPRPRGPGLGSLLRSREEPGPRRPTARPRHLAPSQDGRAVTPGIDRFIYSTAVEADTPEVRAARALGIELVPRPALLAEIVNAGRPGVAIAGTSGKSTITGLVAYLVREAGLPLTALGGAALVGEGVTGCFIPGPVDGPVVAEACESDGTLVGYR